METITGVDLEKLSVGGIFEGDELIISNSGRRMETIRKEPESEDISCFVYNLIKGRRLGSVCYIGGSEVPPEEPDYQRHMKKLMGVGLWH